MKAIADDNGKVWIAIDQGELHATFAISGDGGVPFLPGQEVTIDDARLASVTQQLLSSFGVASVPVVESA